MCDLLLISRRSSHSRYYQRLAENSTLDIKVHVMGAPSIGAVKYLSKAWAQDVSDICHTQFLRKKAVNSVLTRSPLISKVYLKTLTLVQKLRLAKFFALLDSSEVKRVGIWNGGKLPNSVIWQAAKLLGKDMVFFENGLLPNTTTLDHQGVNAKNSLPTEAEFYHQFSAEPPKLDKLEQRTGKKKVRTLHNDLPENYIFVPLQVANDTQIINNSPWIKSMPELFDLLVNTIDLPQFSNTKLVIKEHPSCKLSYHKHHHIHERITFINHLSSETLIDNADAVITINSTVGLEAIIKAKSVITLGDACYNIEGMVLHADDEDRFSAALDTLNHWQPNETLRNQFLNFLSELYVIPTQWKNADSVHFSAFDKRITKTDRFSETTQG